MKATRGKFPPASCIIQATYISFLLRIVDSKPHSRMWYRIGAVRNITGGRKTQPSVKMNEKLKEVSKTRADLVLSLLEMCDVSITIEHRDVHAPLSSPLNSMVKNSIIDGRINQILAIVMT